MLTPYITLIKLIIIVLLALGSFFGGYRWNDQKWQLKVSEMEKKIAVAEEKSNEVNTVVETKVVEKVKVVKENVYINKEVLKEVAAKQLDDKCSVPESTVVLINSASQSEVARGAGSTDGRTSDVKASAVIETVVDNYATCNETREKLIAWQNWYREQKKIFEESQK